MPAILRQVGHHDLAEAVEGDFLDALCHPFSPVGAVGVEVAFHLLPGHRVAAVVAVANIVGTFEGGQGHRSWAHESMH